jgi:hypothetical protein
MPIKRTLEGSAFDPQEFQELVRIFDQIITSLSLKSPEHREAAARVILGIASRQASFDPGKIYDEALLDLDRKYPERP